MYSYKSLFFKNFKEFEILWKKDALDCPGIRAQVFRKNILESL